jgi:ribosome-binding protein aMBF1 (putative translation factor)
MENSGNSPKVFSCEKCDYHTRDSKDYKKHLTTRKHNRNQTVAPSSENSEEERNHKCDHCDKIYKDYSGLWRHKKKCNPRETPANMLNPAPEVTSSVPTLEMYYELQQKYNDLRALYISHIRRIVSEMG